MSRTFLVLGGGLGFRGGSVRSFEKGLADAGGWREEILPVPQIQASQFWAYEKWDTILGTFFFAVFWGLLVANHLPPTPLRNLC